MKLLGNTINRILHGKLKHISRFSLVGVANTLVDFFVFTIFHSLAGVNYAISQILGYSSGVANSFIFNRKWTFGDKSSHKKTFHELLQFIVVNIISLCITVGVLNLLVKHFSINVYIAKIMVTFLAQITNYFGYKLWVFN